MIRSVTGQWATETHGTMAGTNETVSHWGLLEGAAVRQADDDDDDDDDDDAAAAAAGGGGGGGGGRGAGSSW